MAKVHKREVADVALVSGFRYQNLPTCTIVSCIEKLPLAIEYVGFGDIEPVLASMAQTGET